MASHRIPWILDRVRGSERVLDVGFLGEEEHGASLHKAIKSENPQAKLIGLDTDEAGVKAASYTHAVCGSFLCMPFFGDESFNAVILTEVIEHVPDSLSGFREISRVLKNGGKLILTTPCPYGFFHWLKHWILSRPWKQKTVRSFLGNPDHKLFWEPFSLVNLLAINGLKTVELTTRNLDIPYVPEFLRNPPLHFWPFTQMGNYTCIVAIKI